MKIGLVGFEFESSNKGCEALSYSFLSILKRIIKSTEKVVIYNFNACGLGLVPSYYTNFTFYRIVPKLKDIKFSYLRALAQCDYIFDVTMGDSFSDIYSVDYYNSLIKSKVIGEFLCKQYILLPQTYGPFNENKSKIKAKKVIKSAMKVYCRDKMSQRFLESIHIYNSVLASDMAFILPYEKSLYSIKSNKLKLGINVSGLLWRGGFYSTNQFGLSIDYKKYIHFLLEFYSRQNDMYEIYLIPHVIDLKENAYDDDYAVCEQLKNIYSDINLAPIFKNPIEAKSYISNMDIFIGSRMHSTIASFSSEVITIPVSYSRKFEGLFNSLGYEYVINGKTETTESALEKTKDYVYEKQKLIQAQKKSYQKIKKLCNEFEKNIADVIYKPKS